jgi:uncharacterized protein YegP (UPF0339 family)
MSALKFETYDDKVLTPSFIKRVREEGIFLSNNSEGDLLADGEPIPADAWKDEYRWKLTGMNGERVAASTEPFDSKFNAERNFLLILREGAEAWDVYRAEQRAKARHASPRKPRL